MSIYIYLNLLMWLCAYLCLCVSACTRAHTHASLCVCRLLLLCLCACGRAGMEHRHFATELNSQKRARPWPCRVVFRLCIYASDDHSNLYHRLVIHVCLLNSELIRSPLCPSLKRSLQKSSRHSRSEFHQPPFIEADQACGCFLGFFLFFSSLFN